MTTPEGRLIGPFLSPSGAPTGILPHALDSGPPQPEPDDRWTLGPRPPETQSADDEGPSVEVAPVNDVTVRVATEHPDPPGAADA